MVMYCLDFHRVELILKVCLIDRTRLRWNVALWLVSYSYVIQMTEWPITYLHYILVLFCPRDKHIITFISIWMAECTTMKTIVNGKKIKNCLSSRTILRSWDWAQQSDKESLKRCFCTIFQICREATIVYSESVARLKSCDVHAML